MKILIDVMHIPHINFLKNAVKELTKKGFEVDVLCLDRGKNYLIAKEEFHGVKVLKIGVHKGTFFSIIFQANIIRFFIIMKHLIFNKYDKGLSVGSFLLGFGLKFFGKKNLQFYDDPENKKNKFFQKLTASKLFYPFFHKEEGIHNFIALKEWAYLSPKYFSPNINVLNEYELSENKYIFIREVNTNTTNYSNQGEDLISTIANEFPCDVKVLLSLENKHKINNYPENWIILKEPISDIHSLMYYSLLIVSSGDSMAREGAMLGVPSIYCGVREMSANKVMSDKGTLLNIPIEKTIDYVNKITNGQIKTKSQIEFRKKLSDDWDDVTEVIVKNIIEL